MKVLDLFSGIGGFSLGLERAGMETVAFCEIDEACNKVLEKHWPKVVNFRDVKKLTGKYLNGVIDVICGGFPCQDISVAGLKKGIKGERSGLWKEFLRLIEEIKPRYAIIENVANLRSQGLATVLKDLWKIGYDSEWHIISARAVGAPHLRERIWIIAYPNSSTIREQSRRSSRKDREEETVSREHGETGETTNTNSERLQGLRSTERVQTELTSHNSSHDEPSNANHFRLWKPFASAEEKQKWWAKAASSVSHWKEAQSIVCGVDDGISRGLDKHRKNRIKQLGNSVVPQISELIGRAIMEYEENRA
jgi:DNA (cytosine-5)-methyltransferase 1